MPSVELELTWEGPKPPPEELCHKIHVIGIKNVEMCYLRLKWDMHQYGNIKGWGSLRHTMHTCVK